MPISHLLSHITIANSMKPFKPMKSIFMMMMSLVIGLASNGLASELESIKKKFDTPGSNRHLYSRLIAEEGEAGVLWLLGKTPGSPDGDLEEAIGIGLCYARIDVFPLLEVMLKDQNSDKRRFAVLVACQLVDERFVQLFKSLLDDKTKLPNDSVNLTIADCAKEALSMFEWRKAHPNCYKIHRDSALGRASLGSNLK